MSGNGNTKSILNATTEQRDILALQKLMVLSEYIRDHAENPPRAFVFMALDRDGETLALVSCGNVGEQLLLLSQGATRLMEAADEGMAAALAERGDPA